MAIASPQIGPPPEAVAASNPAPDLGMFGDGPIAVNLPASAARSATGAERDAAATTSNAAAGAAAPPSEPLPAAPASTAPTSGVPSIDLSNPPAQLTDDQANAVAQAQAVITNPFGRDVDMTMSLTYEKRDLGELPVLLTRDNHVRIHRQEFLDLIDGLLSADGRKRVHDALGTATVFDPRALAPIGVSMLFDPTGLSVVILRIDPRVQALQSLFGAGGVPRQAGVAPAAFSAYVNASVQASWAQGSNVQPDIQLQGVARYQNLVFESEFVADTAASQALLNGLGADKLTFQRDYARLVYDLPDQDMRFFVGDLDPEYRGQQGAVIIGGVGVLRESQIFDPSRSSTLTNNQQFILNNNAVVDVLRNGVLLQQLNLAAGSYNLNDLPLTTGSNNLQIQIHDASGVRTLNFSTYLDPIDIAPGDYEFGAYAGVLSTTTFQQPQYANDPAFTGFFRKAFMNANAFGVGLQADKYTQMLDGEFRFVVPGGARVELGAAGSNAAGLGGGGSLSAGYELTINRNGLVDDLEASLQYNTAKFRVLGVAQSANNDVVQASATYSHSFTDKLAANVDFYYALERAPAKYALSTAAQLQYSVSRHWSASVGIAYQVNAAVNSIQRGLGAFLSLVWRPDITHRGELRYDGSRNTESATFARDGDNHAGSYSYSAVVDNSPGESDASGQFTYHDNRFDLDVDGGSSGTSFSSITTTPNASIRIGTSIGIVDGHVGIGRPISDSFMLVYPHPSLDGRSVIVGGDLQGGLYDASSGLLGAALDPYLASYAINGVHYDVNNAPLGYDIGPGVINVRPTYRSGYALEVGSDAYVSATGTLLRFDDSPAPLVSGEIEDLDAPKAARMLFFTNSGGRFAIQGLRPGRRYRVDVEGSEPMSFTFETPKKGVALVDLKTVKGRQPGQ